MQKAVLFIVFNRFENTKKVFEQIRIAKPPKLYISCDGPREDVLKEDKTVQQIRKWILENIDWNCEIKTKFNTENLGCGLACSSAITWFFENEEDGIILEDDTVPNQSFFRYCEELLDYYKDNKQIFFIGGFNHLNSVEIEESYFFARQTTVWGWATWADRWLNHYQYDITNYDLDIVLNSSNAYGFKKRWEKVIKLTEEKDGVDTWWDYQWQYAILKNNGLCIIPKENLVTNIGTQGVHFNGDNYLLNTQSHDLFKENPMLHCVDTTLNEDLLFRMDSYRFPTTFKQEKKHKPVFYIHAGSHKTGTTAIQDFFFKYKEELTRDTELYFPKTFAHPNNTYRHSLCKIFKNEDSLNLLLTELAEHRGKDFFITDEEMNYISKEQYELIQEVLPEYDFKIIFYIRKYDDYVKSLFNERTKVAQRWGIAYTDYASFLDNFFPTSIYSPEKRLEIYSAAVGKENLILKIYDRALLKNNDVVDDILDILGVEKISSTESVSSNPNVRGELLPFLATAATFTKNKDYSNSSYEQYNNITSLLVESYNSIPKIDEQTLTKHITEIQSAITVIDDFIPGYKDLFRNKEINIDPPHTNLEGKDVFLATLLYSLMNDVQELREENKQILSTLANNNNTSPPPRKSCLSSIRNSICEPWIKKKAFELLHTKNLKELEKMVDGIIINNSRMAWPYYLKSKVCYIKGMHGLAMTNIQIAIDLEPNTVYFRKFKAVIAKK